MALNTVNGFPFIIIPEYAKACFISAVDTTASTPSIVSSSMKLFLLDALSTDEEHGE